MTQKPIRKQLTNYLLPSEAWKDLSALVGQRIHSIKRGILCDSLDILYQKFDIPPSTPFWTVQDIGPLFISTSEHRTYAFLPDDLTFSLAVRLVQFSVESPTFINDFYVEDAYFPEYLRMRSIVDLTDSCRRFTRGPIRAVKILKLPYDHFGQPIGYSHANEIAVVLSFEDAEDLLVACRMNVEGNDLPGLMTWDMVAADYPTDALKCVRALSIRPEEC